MRFDLPYAAAIVDLDEGPRMMTNLADVEHADLHVGMAVEAAFQKIADDVTIRVLRPAG
jgi:uncharacterized OB-fold protein